MKSSPRNLAERLVYGFLILMAPGVLLAAAPKTARPAAAAVPSLSTEKTSSMGKDKTEIEAYLKQRVATIRAANKAQSDFNSAENQLWLEFWNKVKDERELFEVRVAKQRLNVFESLDSLEPSEHGKTIADFERMQSNVLRSFETAQRTKMASFFASQTERLKAFSAKQEKDRSDFAEEAEASWRQLKSGLAPSIAPRP
jgi:hypothetical protein